MKKIFSVFLISGLLAVSCVLIPVKSYLVFADDEVTDASDDQGPTEAVDEGQQGAGVKIIHDNKARLQPRCQCSQFQICVEGVCYGRNQVSIRPNCNTCIHCSSCSAIPKQSPDGRTFYYCVSLCRPNQTCDVRRDVCIPQ